MILSWWIIRNGSRHSRGSWDSSGHWSHFLESLLWLQYWQAVRHSNSITQLHFWEDVLFLPSPHLHALSVQRSSVHHYRQPIITKIHALVIVVKYILTLASCQPPSDCLHSSAQSLFLHQSLLLPNLCSFIFWAGVSPMLKGDAKYRPSCILIWIIKVLTQRSVYLPKNGSTLIP